MSRTAGLVLSYPLFSMETSKSIQEKMKGIKPTESASFPPARGGKDTSWPLGVTSPSWEGFAGESSKRQVGCQQ